MDRLSITSWFVATCFSFLVLATWGCSGRNPADTGVVWRQALADKRSAPYSRLLERDNYSLVVYNPATGSSRDGALWVIGGKGDYGLLNDVWKSTDGVKWTQVLPRGSIYTSIPTQFSPRMNHATVVYNGAMWVIGGYDGSARNDVWKSTDGVTWTKVLEDSYNAGQFSHRGGHSLVVYDGAMWVIAGQGIGYRDMNDVWKSTDGANWTYINKDSAPSARFSPRRFFATVAFNGAMWVIGGVDGNYHNDVWKSTDGAVWTQVLPSTATPPADQFSIRSNPATVVYNPSTGSGQDGAIWLIGGIGGGGLKDVWTSTDGAHWAQVNASIPFLVRASTVYKKEIWAMGKTTSIG